MHKRAYRVKTDVSNWFTLNQWVERRRRILEQDAAQKLDRTTELQAAYARHEDRRKRFTFYLADGTLAPQDTSRHR
jgi:hypothetical protein